MLSVSRFYSTRMFSQSFKTHKIILKPEALQNKSSAKHFIQLALKKIIVHNCTCHWCPAQPLWPLSQDHLMSLFQIEKILLQQAGSGSLIRKITCPCMLKLDYTSASLLGTRLLPFPNQIFLWWFSTSCRVTACSAASPEQRRGEGWSRM